MVLVNCYVILVNNDAKLINGDVIDTLINDCVILAHDVIIIWENDSVLWMNSIILLVDDGYTC